MRAVGLVMGMATIAMLGACSSDRSLTNIESGQTTPDEFAIIPSKPLSMPPDLALLPTPTPGGANITDPTPHADAVAALGGNPARLEDRGIGAADQALVAAASRNGNDPAIRARLAQADADYRSRNRRRPLEILFGTSVYQRAYRSQALDSREAQVQWQGAGAITQTSPAPVTK